MAAEIVECAAASRALPVLAPPVWIAPAQQQRFFGQLGRAGVRMRIERKAASRGLQQFGWALQIVQVICGALRFLDAHEIPQLDFNVVTRPFQV